jgi:hypothetical protein
MEERDDEREEFREEELLFDALDDTAKHLPPIQISPRGQGFANEQKRVEEEEDERKLEDGRDNGARQKPPAHS